MTLVSQTGFRGWSGLRPCGWETSPWSPSDAGRIWLWGWGSRCQPRPGLSLGIPTPHPWPFGTPQLIPLQGAEQARVACARAFNEQLMKSHRALPSRFWLLGEDWGIRPPSLMGLHEPKLQGSDCRTQPIVSAPPIEGEADSAQVLG